MLLVRVRPDRLVEHWPFIKLAIASSGPPSVALSEATMLRLLMQMLAGGMQVWVANRVKEFPSKAIALLTTSIMTDALVGTKNLLMFSFYGWEDISDKEYLMGFATLKRFALAEGCTSISFYSNNDRLLSIAAKVGFLTDFRYGMIEIGGE